MNENADRATGMTVEDPRRFQAYIDELWAGDLEVQLEGWQGWSPEKFEQEVADLQRPVLQATVLLQALHKGKFISSMPGLLRQWCVRSRSWYEDSNNTDLLPWLAGKMLGSLSYFEKQPAVREFLPEFSDFYSQVLITNEQHRRTRGNVNGVPHVTKNNFGQAVRDILQRKKTL